MEYNPVFIHFEPGNGMIDKWCIARDSVYDIKNILAKNDDFIKGQLVQIKEKSDDCSFPFSTTTPLNMESNKLCYWKFVYVDPAFQGMMRDEKALKWTDLKIGDIIRYKLNRNVFMQVQGIDKSDNALEHIFVGGGWKSDSYLIDWEKVED